MEPNRGAPTPPIALEGDTGGRRHFDAPFVDVDAALVERLRSSCTTVVADETELAETGRDWWPLAMRWALAGEVPGRAAAIARPASTEEVSAVLAVCNEAAVPVTAAAGRSGVCGASVPLHGGVLLDLTGITGVVDPGSYNTCAPIATAPDTR